MSIQKKEISNLDSVVSYEEKKRQWSQSYRERMEKMKRETLVKLDGKVITVLELQEKISIFTAQHRIKKYKPQEVKVLIDDQFLIHSAVNKSTICPYRIDPNPSPTP